MRKTFIAIGFAATVAAPAAFAQERPIEGRATETQTRSESQPRQDDSWKWGLLGLLGLGGLGGLARRRTEERVTRREGLITPSPSH